MGLNRWLGCIENPRTGREADRRPAGPARRRSGGGGRRRPGRPAGRGHRGRTGPPGRPCSNGTTGWAARSRWPPPCPAGPSSSTSPATSSWPPAALGVDLRTGVEADAEPRAGRAPRRGDRGHRRPTGPAVVGRRPRRGWSTSATCWRAGPNPHGEVVVVDELGFHQATSTAELLADRGCAGGDRHQRHGGGPGPRHHPRPGDLEREGPRQGHRPDRRPGAHGRPSDGAGEEDGSPGGAAASSTTRPAPTTSGRCDWVVCSVHQQPDDELWRELRRLPRSPSTASATAWPPAGPTPR